MKYCKTCGGKCREGKRGESFHIVKGYPELETIARETTTTKMPKRKGKRNVVDVPLPFNYGNV